MKDFYDFTPIEEVLASAQTLSIVLPKNLNYDKVAVALALFLSLKKANKQVSVVCPRPMTVEFSSLVGVDKIKDKLEGKNLVISFDYLEDSIEKVSYNIENNKFNLIIQPKEGYPPLSPEKVRYSFLGQQTEAIFIIGASSFEDLGEIYEGNKALFEDGNTINIDINPENKQFAKFNLVNPQMACLGEFISLLLFSLKLPIDEDIASNLMLGMAKATENFSLSSSTPTTFEALAFCLRAGGRRLSTRIIEPREEEKVRRVLPKPPTPKEKPSPEPSPDWFKPKIYKGDTKI